MAGNEIKQKKPRKTISFIDRLVKKAPTIMLNSVTVFYFLFFNITYFAPLLFPSFVGQFPLLFYHSKEFHEFYDHKYRLNKGETKIWLEFGFFLFNFFIFVLSIVLTSFCSPGNIPDDKNWKISVPSNVPNDVQEEIFATAIINREEMLESNRNLIIEPECVGKLGIENDVFVLVNERTKKGKVRYCITCEKFKPDRSHHCKICKKCILKQDHHCPWVGNCVGFGNYKYFLIMIMYGFVGTVFFNVVFTDVIKFMILNEKIVSMKLVLFLSYYIFMIISMISLGIFCSFHLWICLKNYTTYEYITKVMRKDNDIVKYITKDETEVSMFDIGFFNNFTQVFGTNCMTWFLPIKPKNTDDYMNLGINFKVNKVFEYESLAQPEQCNSTQC